LYLPPRLVHWGTSLSDNCMTLSVGCRAPSASELVSRVAEHLSYSMSTSAGKRYTDKHHFLLSSSNSNNTAASITPQLKKEMKRLVSEAVDEILDSKLLWDEIVGCLVTEPKRPIASYASFDDEDDESTSAHALAAAALKDGRGALYRMEGVSFSTSILEDSDDIYYRVFAAGQKFEWKRNKGDPTWTGGDETILLCLARGKPLTKEVLGASHTSSEALSILTDLQVQGFVYYQTEDEDQ
jgi:ribosomal protein L16 Arg81 hydroxylase